MSDRKYSDLLEGDEDMGMTNEQYKGFLIDQLRSWKRVLELAKTEGSQTIQKLAEEEIEDLNEKMKF